MLTVRQKAIFDFIVEFRRNHGCSPSIPEIQKAFLIRSPNGVVGHLLALEAKGLLRRANRGSRQIDVVEGSAEHRESTYCLPVRNRTDRQTARASDFVMIDEKTLGFAPAKGAFGLRVVDKSMKRVGVEPGDVVLIEPTTQAKEGEIVALHKDGEMVLRRTAARAKPKPPLQEVCGVARLLIRRLG